MRMIKRLIAVLASLIVIAVSSFAIYAGSYYHALPEAVSASQSSGSITVKTEDGNLIFIPDNPRAGLVFYPGGKVEHTAYSPLMKRLAESGILCVLLKTPANLAVLDMNAANGIPEKYPDIREWYIGGHSLGGVAASSYLSDNPGEYTGLILLASYSTADLSLTGIKALSIYGSEDGVLNRESYTDNFSNLPADTSEYIIDGGCHAYFGSYGPQKGDGEPTITRERQIEITVDKINEFTGG